MGATRVTATIRNPAEPDRAWEGVFLVDTGAHDTFVPRKHLEAIGLKPEGIGQYLLADGSPARFDLAVARVELMGRFGGINVVFGADDAEPLLGVIALESVGAEVDPVNERLRLTATKRA